MKKTFIFLVLGAVVSAASASAATSPTPMGVPACPANMSAFFPTGRMEQAIGGQSLNFGFSAEKNSLISGECTLELNADHKVSIVATVASYHEKSVADSTFNAYRSTFAPNSTIATGGGCDRYISFKGASGNEVIQAEKGTYDFIIASSVNSKITAAALAGVADYACSQAAAAGAQASPSASPTAIAGSTSSPSPIAYGGNSNATSSGIGIFDSPDFYLYLLLGVLILTAIGLALWLFMHHKNNVAAGPATSPTEPPQTPPSTPPTMPSEPPATPPTA